MKKRTENKALFLAILSFLVLLLMAALEYQKPLTAGADTATLVIDFDGSLRRTFQGQVVDQMTVLEALHTSAEAGDIKFTYYIDNGDVVINSINGEINHMKNAQWFFYINGQPVKTGDINKIFVKVGDVIEVKFQ